MFQCRILVLAFFLVSFSTYAQSEITRDWDSFVQTIDASFLKKKVKFKVTASVKVEALDSNASAGLWVRVDNKKGGQGFFDNMRDRPIQLNQWKTYSIEGTMDQSAEKINIGGICSNNGKFYFDNFEFFVENDKGELQRANLSNPDFEEPIVVNKIPGWKEGIRESDPVRVKGFAFTSSNEKANGSHSLLIEGKGIARDTTYLIGPIKGYTPQIGTLVTMLNNLSARVERTVSNIKPKDVDHLLDENANSIGALVMHLAAAEAYYQVFTFENRGFNEEEKEKWQDALDLGENARKRFRGKDISYYLEEYRNVRKKTLEELRKRDDAWLLESKPGSDVNTYFFWFHVMEHQSSHLGQVLLLKKRLPKPKEELKEKLIIK